MRALYGTLALLLAALEVRLWPPSFPDLAFALFLPLTLVLPFHWSLALGITLGLFQQGVDPSVPWVLPLLYTLAAGSSRFLRAQFLSLGPWFTLGYFLLWSALVKLVLLLSGASPSPLLSAVLSALLTGLAAYLLHLPWARALE